MNVILAINDSTFRHNKKTCMHEIKLDFKKFKNHISFTKDR